MQATCAAGSAAVTVSTLQPKSVSCWSDVAVPAAGCDVLWGGCPMVTLPLERMASRVAASLCYATGLGPEMVVSSQQEYEVWRGCPA